MVMHRIAFDLSQPDVASLYRSLTYPQFLHWAAFYEYVNGGGRDDMRSQDPDQMSNILTLAALAAQKAKG